MIGVLSYIKNMFVPKISEWDFLIEDFEKVHLKQAALDTVLGRVTASANLVNFVTKDKELAYILNVTPNYNENAKDFRTKLIRQLVMDGEVLVIQENAMWYIADDFVVNDKVFAEKTYSSIFVDGRDTKKTFLSSKVYHFKYHNTKM